MPQTRKRAWNGWYHCTGSTYGEWVRGDERGWRARHHREHVNGDYKNPPPPGRYAAVKAQSRVLMRRKRVQLSVRAREQACAAFAESLHDDAVEVIAIGISARHWHVLARFTRRDAAVVTADRKGKLLLGRRQRTLCTHARRDGACRTRRCLGGSVPDQTDCGSTTPGSGHEIHRQASQKGRCSEVICLQGTVDCCQAQGFIPGVW